MRRLAAATALILLGVMLGCSSSTDNPAAPAEQVTRETTAQSSHQLWGLWQFAINPDGEALEITPLRSPAMHLNVLRFLEPPPFTFLSLESLEFNGNIIEAGIGLRHPFLGLTEFTGFDVCGILISRGSAGGFTDPDLLMPGGNDLHLVNPDGYSRWWNPVEFPVNPGTIFGYTDGLLGTPDAVANYTATLNGYKYFCDELAENSPLTVVDPTGRGIFSAGAKNIRHYTIRMGTAGLIFNYAVDACWQFPDGGPPWQVPDDFAPAANRREAWNAVVNVDENTLWNDGSDSGGELSLTIDIYDWYDAALNLVTVESPGNFGAVVDASPSGGGTGYSTYEIGITSATPAQDEIELLITAASEATGYGGLLPGKTVAAYFTAAVPVSDEPPQQLTINLVDITPPGWPATLHDVWVEKDYAYCTGPYNGLLVLDISGTGDPAYVGGHDTDGLAAEVQVDGDYCYIADGTNGLVILDISDPSNPVAAGSYPTDYDMPGLHVVDGLCYVANGKGGVQIFDVGGGTQGGSPDNPQVEGKFGVAYAALDIFVDKGIAYVSDYETRFLILDVGGGTHGGSPDNPQWEADMPYPACHIEEVLIRGDFAYLGCVNPHQIIAADVSTPSSPWQLGIYPTTWGVQDLWADLDYLYSAQYSDGLVIYRISKSGYLNYEGSYNTAGYAFGVCKTEDGYAYVADYYDGLKVIDASTPSSPEFVGRYFTPSHITDIQVDDGYVYAADGTCGIAVVDVGGGVGSPTEPLCVARKTQPSGDTDSRGVWAEDGYAYLGGGYLNYHFSVVDVGGGSGSPENPIYIGDHSQGGNRLYGMQKMGCYVYVAAYSINGGSGGLEVYDVDGGVMGGSPSNPKRVTTKSTSCAAQELWAEDGYVYIACGQNSAPSGLYCFDAGGGTSGSPDNPVLVDSYITSPSHLYDVNVVDGYAYCVDSAGLRVFDVGGGTGAPDDIKEAGSYSLGALTRGLAVAYGYAFLIPGQSVSGVVAIDVGGGQAGGSPDNPQFVDEVSFPGGCDAFCAAIDGQYAYVGTHNLGMRIIELWQ